MSRLEALSGLLSPQMPVEIPAEKAANLSITPSLILISQIRRSPFQPRFYFDSTKIEKMATAFSKYRERGDYPKTAILVRPLKSTNEYELIFGEQRKIAHEKAGFVDILAFVDASITDEEARELALTENLLREDLNPIEKTEAILNLAAVRLNVTPQEIKQLLDRAANENKKGKPQTNNVIRTSQWEALEIFFNELPDQITPNSFRTNYLPLLNLPKDVLEVIHAGKLHYTKARAIASITDTRSRQQLLQKTIEQDLPIREIRDHVRELKQSLETPSQKEQKSPPTVRSISQRISQLSKKVEQVKAWHSPKQAQEVQVLLMKLEKLLQATD